MQWSHHTAQTVDAATAGPTYMPDMLVSSCQQGQELWLSNCLAVHRDQFTSAARCCCGCRIYVTFEELPVQNIAVGNSIMRFATMHTAKSAEHISGGQHGLEACSYTAQGSCEDCSLPRVRKHAYMPHCLHVHRHKPAYAHTCAAAAAAATLSCS